MDLADVIAPAVTLAKSHTLNKQQAYFLKLLRPIMTLLPDGKAIYEPDGKYLKEGDQLVNNELAVFFEELAKDKGENFYKGALARQIGEEMADKAGLLTREDLANYQVQERPPMAAHFRGYQFFTAPKPSLGGALIALSLSLQSLGGLPDYAFGSSEYLLHTTALMQEVEKLREKGVSTASSLSAFLNDPEQTIASTEAIKTFTRGTTHISVADKEGNCAAMTCSNGEGAGYFAPGTGIMLNNMMGEDDLHPEGFHSSPPGQRVGSMMSPSLLMKNDEVHLVIGSGGSKRIRTAISQVLSQVVDYKKHLQEAVDAPRLHWDGDTLQVEPGFSASEIEPLRKNVPVNEWQAKGVYFGGVHAVIPGKEGAADPRRGGKVLEIP